MVHLGLFKHGVPGGTYLLNPAVNHHLPMNMTLHKSNASFSDLNPYHIGCIHNISLLYLSLENYRKLLDVWFHVE